MDGRHYFTTWEYRHLAVDPNVSVGPDAHFQVSLYGWACAPHRTWGVEETPRARTHAVNRHVDGIPDGMNVNNVERTIERWWEEEAAYTADCVAPDPSLCNNHVFEEAVRVDGEIVACTVHGGRLARSLAAYLAARQAELEQQIRELARQNIDQMRLRLEGNWPVDQEPRHKQGCGARTDPQKRCLCNLGEEAHPLPPELRRPVNDDAVTLDDYYGPRRPRRP